MDLPKMITQSLADAVEPHLPNINEAAIYLKKNTPVSGALIRNTFDGITASVALCHLLASHSGWWCMPDGTPIDPNNPYVFGTKMALVHAEVSEALEGARKNKDDDHLPHRKAVEVELADAVIRIFDTAGAMRLDLAGAIIEKLAKNQQREDHKLENRNKVGGKVF